MKPQISTKKSYSGSRYIPMTPYNLYMEEVASISEAVRALNQNLDYVPAQLGGPSGQLGAVLDKAVLQFTDFQNNE